MEFTPPLIIHTMCAHDERLSMHGWDQLAELGQETARQADPAPAPAQAIATNAARLVAETLTGHRDPKQLRQWLSASECERLMAWTQAHRGERIRLNRMNLIEVSPERVEGQLHFDYGRGRLCATLCLVSRAGRWSCRQLNVLLPGAVPHP